MAAGAVHINHGTAHHGVTCYAELADKDGLGRRALLVGDREVMEGDVVAICMFEGLCIIFKLGKVRVGLRMGTIFALKTHEGIDAVCKEALEVVLRGGQCGEIDAVQARVGTARQLSWDEPVRMVALDLKKLLLCQRRLPLPAELTN